MDINYGQILMCNYFLRPRGQDGGRYLTVAALSTMLAGSKRLSKILDGSQQFWTILDGS